LNLYKIIITALLTLAGLFFIQNKIYSQEEKTETGDIDFEFKASETFSKSELSDVLLLPREKYFNRLNLEEDLERLKKFYFDNGFFDAIIDTSTNYIKSDNIINIKFIVIENARYTIREIRLLGLDKVPANVLQAINTKPLIEAGKPYNKEKISLEKDRIIGILQDNGYFYAQTDTSRNAADSSRRGIVIGKYSQQMQENPEFKHKVIVTMRFIGTDDVYRFGKISITQEKNKFKIDNFIIERELAFKTGEIYNKNKVIQSERNFTKLAIIQLARVLPDSIDKESKTIDMNVDITLNKKYELTPSIYTTYESNRLFAGAGIEYKDKNFFGGGRVFSITLEGLYNSRYINIIGLKFSLYQPFLFRNNITATLTPEIVLVNYDKNIQYLISKNLLRLSYYIAPYTFYNNAYSDLTFDYLQLRVKSYTQEGGAEIPEFRLYYVNSILGLTLLHNNTNNLFNPSNGFYHTITVESSGALPRFINIFNKSLLYSQYIKLNTINSFYFDLTEEKATTILATHFEIGDIIEYGKGENIIEVDKLYKFFMGGGNSLRGWKAQTGGILANPSEGGKFLLEGSTELRRKPFPPRSFLNPVWFVLFLDYGNVWESDGKFKLNQIALSTGLGIRYDTFIGPIRIDFGFKLYDPLGGEDNKWLWQNPKTIFKNKFAIQFGLGNAF
jgi:outer membrane protein assembly factor BamA